MEHESEGCEMSEVPFCQKKFTHAKLGTFIERWLLLHLWASEPAFLKFVAKEILYQNTELVIKYEENPNPQHIVREGAAIEIFRSIKHETFTKVPRGQWM